MTMVKELMHSSLFVARTNPIQIKQSRQLGFGPVLVPFRKKKVGLMKKDVTAAVATITEDLAKVVPAETVEMKVGAVVTVRHKKKEDLKETFVRHLDAIADRIGRNVVLQLVSTEIDFKTRAPKVSKEAILKGWSKKLNTQLEGRAEYTAELIVDSNFGVPGAIMVTNKHLKELFLESITIKGLDCGAVHFPCNSWVQPHKDHPEKRIFFSNKTYLPSETPEGIKVLREEELKCLRGDGNGIRKLSDRIYEYDVYNDLGKPDKGIDVSRPTLGGEQLPYPRRCRTGRHPTLTDKNAESRVEKPLPMYVPRDEKFEEPKEETFLEGRKKALLKSLIPLLKTSISSCNNDFKRFSDVDSLYDEEQLLKLGLPNVLAKLKESGIALKYDTPKIVSKDKFAWLRDDEFGRLAIAGINPGSIERMKVFPPVSNLDPQIYGPQESALKEEHILGYLHGLSVQQALEENRLYIVDFHDIYLPYLDGINALDGRKAYATRTIFFLTQAGTLKPIAIELGLPAAGPSSRSKRVVTPAINATTNWEWQLAKAHVCCNDAGVHQLVNHWLRTHACLEPYILAAHRQLSVMHPIYKLLDPHMRYTLEINALARQSLIASEGIIETCFTPGRYSMQMSAAAYRNWRFDLEGLPADLIRRGMAVADPTQPHGLKLMIEDYPYASDGLLIWAAIENWVRSYVGRYYPNPGVVRNDKELQSWYAEFVHVGHADLRHASWWPTLSDGEDLVSILTTLIWLGSAQHGALNFGQYPLGGYVPNRPTLMRRLIPTQGDPEYTHFLADPQRYFLASLPSMLQATLLMAVVDTLSTHSPDEVYLGDRRQESIWSGDAQVEEAFNEFAAEIERVEKEIERRNRNPRLRNRCGAGVVPYELLAPSSGPGITCRGIPNSVTI